MNEQKFDFGGSHLIVNGIWIIGAICFVASMILFFYFESPYFQVLSLPLFCYLQIFYRKYRGQEFYDDG
jgi:hypothetical protein